MSGVEPTPENAERLLRALEQFGFGGLGLTIDDFVRSGAASTRHISVYEPC